MPAKRKYDDPKEAIRRARAAYDAKNADVRVRMPFETKNFYVEYCAAHEMSMNALIMSALKEYARNHP